MCNRFLCGIVLVYPSEQDLRCYVRCKVLEFDCLDEFRLQTDIEAFIRLGKGKSLYAFLQIFNVNRVEQVLFGVFSFTDLWMGSRRTSFRVGHFHVCI